MVPKPPEQLETELQEQLCHLRNSCRDYDEDKEYSEAKRIATVIRILFHQGRKGSPLLDSVANPPVTFHSTRIDGAPALVSPGGKPLVHSCRVLVNRKTWWSDEEFDVNGIKYSRKGLVLDMANKEGGAHVDRVSTPNYLQANSVSDPAEICFPNKETYAFAALRTIAAEVLESFGDSTIQ